MRPLVAGLAALVLASAPAHAQRRQITLEGSFVRGALGFARGVRPRLLAGVEVGFGIPELDRTFVPEQDALGGPDFNEILQVGTLVRQDGGGGTEPVHRAIHDRAVGSSL
jgi:hypothetical protein